MEETVSIALCTYNGAKYLPMQLDSILQQTYPNLELVIVDDNSTDDTQSLLKLRAKDDCRIKLFLNDENLGFNANFEKAIKLCSGNFIAIADQDDVWKLDKLSRLMENIGNNWLIFSNSQFIDANDNLIGGQILKNNFSLAKRDYRSLLFSNFVTGHTVLFTKEFLSYLLPIPYIGYYDWWMGFVALYHNKIICLNEKLTLHRIHSRSVMYREKDNDRINSRNERYHEILANLCILKDYKYLNSKDKSLINTIYLIVLKNDLKSNFSLALAIFKSYSIYFPDLKERNLLSRINYAIKFTRRLY